MKKDKLKIIYYHTISDFDLEYFPKKTTQSIDTFNKQIKYLNKKYNIISLNEAQYKFENKEPFKNNLVITTDDGFKENYTIIAPILSDFNLTFTALLCNNLIDNKSLMWRNILFFIKSNVDSDKINKVILRICSDYQLNLPEKDEDLMAWSLRVWPYNSKDILATFFWQQVFDLDINDFLREKRPYLTSKEIRELLSSGFSIGSHSRSHPYFKDMSNKEIMYETIEAADELEKKFKTKINAFSFPFERPQDPDFLDKVQKNIDKRFNTILGIHDSGKNHITQASSWERISMEFDYYYSLINFYISPIKQRIIK